MIGCSKRARTRYHKERGFTGWAKCHLIPMDILSQDELLGEERSVVIICEESGKPLSRCPECWK